MTSAAALPLLAGVLVFGLGACSGDDADEPKPRTQPTRKLPDIDPPSAATLPPTTGRVADARWLDKVSEQTHIPRRALEGYANATLQIAAEDKQCALAWNTLSGIGQVESIHGQINGSKIGSDGLARPEIIGIALNGKAGVKAIEDTDDGRLDNDKKWDRAVGPMQFIPTTWRKWGGRQNPQNIDSAALAAGRYLCDSGVQLDNRRGWLQSIFAYNQSDEYAGKVAKFANQHRDQAAKVS